MIRQITIENFKSIRRLELPLGRVTVLIGENGSGKSNILEAIAFCAAADAQRLDHEFLGSRGIRVTGADFMRSAFGGSNDDPIDMDVLWKDQDSAHNYRVTADAEAAVPKWRMEGVSEVNGGTWNTARHFWSILRRQLEDTPTLDSMDPGARLQLLKSIAEKAANESPHSEHLRNFLVYSPENTALRTFQGETQITPLGIRGEGLFAYLKRLAQHAPDTLAKISAGLELIDWFDHLEVPADLAPFERTLSIRDRYLVEGQLFDQRSTNEGFLFLLFYFTLMFSRDTPSFFAIDNVDAALNPKLCSEVAARIVRLAKEQDRQVILTTHNPATLDGLDLNDDEQRLLVVSRNQAGHTTVRRVKPLKPLEGDAPMRLSEAFIGGYIGGLPKNF